MVGKSTIINRYTKGKFAKIDERTINTTAFKKNINLNGNIFTLNIWDTAGEEKYHALAPIFYNKADGCIIVYDCTRKETFERAEVWFKELNEATKDSTNPRIILVGNKIDLPEKCISSEDGNKLAHKYNSNFIEVSALSGFGIENIFETITNDIYNYKLQIKENLEIEQKNANKNKGRKKLIISSGNERYEKRNNEDGSCGCCCC